MDRPMGTTDAPTRLGPMANSGTPGLSEEQITDIFSSAGKVERFRLVYDSETGRPKGFGFADYPDTGSICPPIQHIHQQTSHS